MLNSVNGFLALSLAILVQGQLEGWECSDPSCDFDASFVEFDLARSVTPEDSTNPPPMGPRFSALAISGMVTGCMVFAAVTVGTRYEYEHGWILCDPKFSDDIGLQAMKGKYPRTEFSSSMYDSMDTPPMLPPIPPLAYDPEAFYALQYLRVQIPMSDTSSSILTELGSDYEAGLSPVLIDIPDQLEPVVDQKENLPRLEEGEEFPKVELSRSSCSVNLELEESLSHRPTPLQTLPGFTLHTSSPAPPVTSLQSTNGRMEGPANKAKLPFVPAKARLASPAISYELTNIIYKTMTQEDFLRRPMLAAKSTSKHGPANSGNRARKGNMLSEVVHATGDTKQQESAPSGAGQGEPVDAGESPRVPAGADKPSIPHGSSPALLARFKDANEYRATICDKRASFKKEIETLKTEIQQEVALIEATHKTLKETQFYLQRIKALLSEKLSGLDIGEVGVDDVVSTMQKISCYVKNHLAFGNILNLSLWEQQEFFQAIKKIKLTGEYDALVREYMDVYQSIHGGNLYLPFHRYFLKRIEQTMQKHYPSVNLPYWDYTADWAAPHLSPALALMGYGGGQGRLKSCINDGPLKNFQMKLPERRCVKRGYFKNEAISAFMNEIALKNIIIHSESFTKINSLLKGVTGMVTFPLGGDIRNVQLMANEQTLTVCGQDGNTSTPTTRFTPLKMHSTPGRFNFKAFGDQAPKTCVINT
ncbi:hypothetical protein K493DRAFT_345671 [Basidiobolus meristosporus CBS 931.73]|uniref:Tyrosinase copper-binding domain-containing protein n=1 Tax=Basidiobolus meristosporus CBS 931.73 TaxID=1314790 RepID=A0A1Y1Z2B1_9FUNG|nr:hypothetical protein K493DRAFT_345671 [Basidiobolus meristosporus CBS 931.73]|eukprot:ORY04326.1 hypothetical protein K493DRAFT_345671 [Basidiobolus meristosporus CBS 931.73]